MPPPREVVQAINTQFQKPKVDPEWLEQCCDWLVTDQDLSPTADFPKFMERVKDQLFKSDLVDSMLHGTGLDVHIVNFSGLLQGPPVLVQIMEITEIGTSAFQLEQIRAAREERMSQGVGNVEGEEDGDVEVEGEGPMPKYPRGTLHFKLSDGATVFEAMEYRNLPQFALGTTQLGFKLQLRGTRFQNGMAFLEPASINLLGGYQEDLESEQLSLFKQSLYGRLGRQLEPNPENQVQLTIELPSAARAPLRDISPPATVFPQHNDDVDMEPRRRVPTSSSINKPTSPSGKTEPRQIARLPSRQSRKSDSIGSQSEVSSHEKQPPLAERATLVYGGTSQQSNATSSYFGSNAQASGSRTSRGLDNTINMEVEKLDFNFVPTARQLSRTFSSPSPFPSPEPPSPNQRQGKKDPSFDFYLLDEVDNDENAPPVPPNAVANKGKGRAEPLGVLSSLKPPKPSTKGNGNSSDYDMYDENDFADADFLENLDRVEKAALGAKASTGKSKTSIQPPSSGSGSGSGASYIMAGSETQTRSQTLSSMRPTSSPVHVPDVIEIDSDADEDKENVRVNTRHTRRRMDLSEVVSRGRSPAVASHGLNPSQALSQKTGRPLVLAMSLSDVIDLSDSD